MIFLHGGGDHPDFREVTFGRFVRAATTPAGCTLALIVVEETADAALTSFRDYEAIFQASSSASTHIEPILVRPGQRLQKGQLEQVQPTGVFVCGGSTPLYQQVLCHDSEWLSYMHENDIPYGGTSAGAAIAASRAILGGWQLTCDGISREILFRGASEGLDPITVKDGLGLVPFAIDVHASQMGTLTRLLHAVEARLVPEGWAVDENTMLQVNQAKVSVFGQGQAYKIRRDQSGSVLVSIHHAQRL